MKTITFQDNWLESWKYSYPYDLMEIYGDMSYRGYAYAYANRRQHTLELVQKVAQPGAKILDVAAAQGNFTLSLAELGYEVTWNDLREELIDYVKLKWERGTIHYAPGNVFELGFDTYFDVVLITEIIEHVAYPDDFLKKIAQMLKPGGHIIMSTPNGEYFRNGLPKFSDCPDPSQFEAIQFKPNADGHIFLLHLDELELLAQQAGLVVLETRIFNNPLTNGHLKFGTLLEYLPRHWVDTCENITNSTPWSLQKKLHHSMVALLTSQSNQTS
ncbi:methyltransferase domain-containing protein [Moorena sp. SIO3I6]|uniref:class I SAM-dependent methyltransferase n=1 Tax=Moorena sp. SIO3I6 TaxID=2607831 RepID=UPI0013F71452|nr:methyltransferase domain-containing protein [Moorena sp. SIO3I6]NEO44550.1 methyltransferase domain-containing protein [Moorena sp. SIO4A3]NEP25912.1 methyltransferase domain-containing protein [Moorena sp. SIO3I6]